MFCAVFNVLLVYFLTVIPSSLSLRKSQNVFQKINEDPDLSSFNNLLKNNRIARLDLNYKAATVFVPEDAAFERFNGVFDQQLTYYHMSYEVKNLQQLIYTNKMVSTKEVFPPIWISKNSNDIYVNNAKVIEDRSDFLGKTRDDESGEVQMLHVLDDVLDPFIRNTSIEATAYQLLSTPHHWGISHTLEMFYERVVDNSMEELFQQEGSNTFFIPVDKNIDDHRYNSLDNYTIQAHVIPKQVLFTRPANKQFFYETACNGDYIYILDSFIERGDKIFAKSTTVLGDTSHLKGEIVSEILVANIPVKNGVVHLIGKPLVIFDRELRPFPFLPVFYKVSTDPFLDYSFRIGENTGLNVYLQNPAKKITYFIPRDQAWKKVFENRIFTRDEQMEILSRHIVLDDTEFTMERLLYLTESSTSGNFVLNTLGGGMEFNVVHFEGSYFITFNGTTRRVVRANYMCQDGVVHVIEEPFLDTEEQEVEFSSTRAYDSEASTTEEGSVSVWDVLEDIFS